MYARITTPLLHQFIGQLEVMPEALVQGIIEKLNQRLGNQSPDLAHFDISLDTEDAPGVLPFLNTASGPEVSDLLVDPGANHLNMPPICLLLVRFNGDLVPFPGEGLLLEENDRMLLWGPREATTGCTFSSVVQICSSQSYHRGEKRRVERKYHYR